MTITDRAYRSPDDFKRLCDFLAQVRSDIDTSHYLHQGDLTWQLFHMQASQDPADIVHLWEDERGALIGFVLLYPPHGMFDIQVHSWHRDLILEERMMVWAESRSLALYKGGQDDMFLTMVHQNDRLRRYLLEHAGYVRQGAWLYLERSLQIEIPKVEVPNDFQVRSITSTAEAALRAAVLAAAFEAEPDTERYQQLMQAPGYTSNLDLVAVAPDGQFGAFCMCWVDAVNSVGQFEPVGTAPAFRRQGLAQVTLLEGLRRMSQVGATTAIVIVEADEQAAKQLYESVGFLPRWTIDGYTKRIR